MKKTILTLLGLIILFLCFLYFDILGATIFRVLGLSGLCITYLVITIFKKSETNLNRVFFLSISLIAFTLFCKYYYWQFWDIPALLCLPLFLLLFYLFSKLEKPNLHTITAVILIVVTIPMCIPYFKDISRQIIPIRWYDRMYDVGEAIPIKIPNDITSPKADSLSSIAYNLMINERYSKATKTYLQALSIDSNSIYILFDLSHCYAEQNQLEEAVKIISKAIKINPSYYNIANRGLYYYKIGDNQLAINDLNWAISINDTIPIYHINLALAYYHNNDYEFSCLEFEKARQLDSIFLREKEFLQMKNKACNKEYPHSH